MSMDIAAVAAVAAVAAAGLFLRFGRAYLCVSGATAAIKLVGEDFPFTADSSFFYLRINHNSVLGVRCAHSR